MNFPIIEVLLFAILQGVTELFPISSLGHSVLVPVWLHWAIDRTSPAFVPFMVVLHLGTATALLVYFWRDWRALIGGFVAARGGFGNENSRLMWLLLFGTIPAGLIGLIFQKSLEKLFDKPVWVLAFLAINGVVLFLGDYMSRRHARRELDDLKATDALSIGLAQALALLPGISRSGVTVVGGLSHGLSYASAARFSFLLATPIIGAAGLFAIPKLLKLGSQVPWALMIGAGILAGVTAYLSTWFLMTYFKKAEIESLRPFGWYCLIVGIGGLLVHYFA